MGDVFHTSDLCEALEPEVEEGNHEYKRHLVSPSAARFQELVTQLQYRLHEGANEALYELGVEDDGEIVGLDEDISRSRARRSREWQTRSTRTRRSSRNGS